MSKEQKEELDDKLIRMQEDVKNLFKKLGDVKPVKIIEKKEEFEFSLDIPNTNNIAEFQMGSKPNKEFEDDLLKPEIFLPCDNLVKVDGFLVTKEEAKSIEAQSFDDVLDLVFSKEEKEDIKLLGKTNQTDNANIEEDFI